MSELLDVAPQIGPEELKRIGEIMLAQSRQPPPMRLTDLARTIQPLDFSEGRSRRMILAHNNRN